MKYRDIAIGIFVGLILGVLLTHKVLGRYEVGRFGLGGILIYKMDKWTGKTWTQKYINSDLEEINTK